MTVLGLAERAAWRPLLEGMAASVAAALRGVTGTEQGRVGLEIGASGDRTAVVDRVAEDAVMAACERLAMAGMRFHLRSEEVGERDYGAPSPVLLVDPVDGSRNAMFGLPYYCTSLAVLDGPTLGDVAAGVVRSLSGPGTYSAVRGGGAQLDGRPLAHLRVGLGRGGSIPMLVLEAHRAFGRTLPHEAAPLAALLRSCGRVRLLGSSALSLCMAAAGAASAVVAPDGMRAWDCAAGLLLLREVGAIVTAIDGTAVDPVPAEFGRHTTLVASLDAGVHRRVLELLAEPG